MQEVEFARETLRFAQMFLHMGVTNTWLYRMLVGKLYYAAHHLGRRLLIEIGMQPEQWRANVHQRVLDELRQQYVATRRISLDAWVALDKLRSLRRKADYELATPVRLRKCSLRSVVYFVNHSTGLFRYSRSLLTNVIKSWG